MSPGGLNKGIADKGALTQELHNQEVQQGIFKINIDEVYEGDVYTLRWFQAQNFSYECVVVKLRSNLGDRIAFQLYNENLNQTLDELESEDESELETKSKTAQKCSQALPLFSIKMLKTPMSQNLFPERNHNQIFNNINHISEIELLPKEKKRFVLCFLPNVYNSQPKRKNIYNEVGEQKDFNTELNGFYEVNGLLFFLGYKKKLLLEGDAEQIETANDDVSGENNRQITSLHPPEYKIIAKFRSKVCLSVMKIDFDGHDIFFPACTLNKLYFKDFKLINCSAIKLFWTLNAEDLFNKKEVNISFLDPDTDTPITFDPILPYSDKKIRVTFLPKEVGEFRYEFQLENVVNSDNFITVGVNAVVRSESLKEPVIITPDSTLDFGACYTGVWNEQKIVLRCESELPVDVLFHSSIEDVKFRLKGDDLTINNATHRELGLQKTSISDSVVNENVQNDVFLSYIQEKNNQDSTYYDENDISESSDTIVLDPITINEEQQSQMNELLSNYEHKGDLTTLFDYILPETRNSLTPSNTVMYDKDENGSTGEEEDLLEDDREDRDIYKKNTLNSTPSENGILFKSMSTSYNNETVYGEHGVVEEITLRPGTERTIEILYKQKLDPRTADFWGGNLVKRDFKIVIRCSVVGTSIVGKKTIHCKALTCTSFLKLEPQTIAFGDTYVNTTKTKSLTVKNMSYLPVKFFCKYSSKVLSINSEIQSIPPNGEVILNVQINPKKATPEYKKSVAIVNLNNESDEQELIISSTNIDNMSYKTLNSFFYHVILPRHSDTLDFGVSTCNSPVLRTFKLFNVSKSKINVSLSSSLPEEIEMFTVNKKDDGCSFKNSDMTELRERAIETIHPSNVLGGLNNDSNRYGKLISLQSNIRKTGYKCVSSEPTIEYSHAVSPKFGRSVVKNVSQKNDSHNNSTSDELEAYNRLIVLKNGRYSYYYEKDFERVNYLDLAIDANSFEKWRLMNALDKNNLYVNQPLLPNTPLLYKLRKTPEKSCNSDQMAKEISNTQNSTSKILIYSRPPVASNHADLLFKNANNSESLSSGQLTDLPSKLAYIDQLPKGAYIRLLLKGPETVDSDVLCNIINSNKTINNDSSKSYYDDADNTPYNYQQLTGNIFTQKDNIDDSLICARGNISTNALLSLLESITGYYPGKFKNPEHYELYVRSVMFLMRELRYAIKYKRLIHLTSLELNSEEELQIVVIYTCRSRENLNESMGRIIVEGKVYVKLDEYDKEVLISGLHTQCDKDTTKPDVNFDNYDKTEIPIFKINMKSILCSSTIKVSQKSINFGYINRHEVCKKSIVIFSYSSLPVLYSLVKSGSIASGNIIFSEGSLGIIPPLGKKRVEFTFKPTLHGNFHEVIKIENITNPMDSLTVNVKANVREKNEFSVSDTYIDFGTIQVNQEVVPKRYITISNANFKKAKSFEVTVNPAEDAMDEFDLELVFEKIEPNSENVLSIDIPSPKYLLSKEAEERIEVLEAKLEVAKRKCRQQATAKILCELQKLRSGADFYFSDDENDELDLIPQSKAHTNTKAPSKNLTDEHVVPVDNFNPKTYPSYTANTTADRIDVILPEKKAFNVPENVAKSPLPLTSSEIQQVSYESNELSNRTSLTQSTPGHCSDVTQLFPDVESSPSKRTAINEKHGRHSSNLQILSYKRGCNKIYFSVGPRVMQPIVIYPRLSLKPGNKFKFQTDTNLSFKTNIMTEEIPVSGSFQIYEYKNKDVIKTVRYHSKFAFSENNPSKIETGKFNNECINVSPPEQNRKEHLVNSTTEFNVNQKCPVGVAQPVIFNYNDEKENTLTGIEHSKIHPGHPILITASQTSQKFVQASCDCTIHKILDPNIVSNNFSYKDNDINLHNTKILDKCNASNDTKLTKNVNISEETHILCDFKSGCLYYETVDLGNITIFTQKTCYAFIYNHRVNKKKTNIALDVQPSKFFHVIHLEECGTLNEGEKKKIEFIFVPTAHGNHNLILNIEFPNTNYPKFKIEYTFYAVYPSYITFPSLYPDSSNFLDMGFSYIDVKTGQILPTRLPVKNTTELDIYLSAKSNLSKQCLVTLSEDMNEHNSVVKVPALETIDAFIFLRPMLFSQSSSIYKTSMSPAENNAISNSNIKNLDTFSDAFRELKGGIKFMVYIENDGNVIKKPDENDPSDKLDDNNDGNGNSSHGGRDMKLILTKTLMFSATIGISTLEVDNTLINFGSVLPSQTLSGSFKVKNIEYRLPLIFSVTCNDECINILPYETKITQRDMYDEQECSRLIKFELLVKKCGFNQHTITVNNLNNQRQIVDVEIWTFIDPKMLEYFPEGKHDLKENAILSYCKELPVIEWIPVFGVCNISPNVTDITNEATFDNFFFANNVDYYNSLEKSFNIKNVSGQNILFKVRSKLSLEVFLESENCCTFSNHRPIHQSPIKLFYQPTSLAKGAMLDYGTIFLSNDENVTIRINVPKLSASYKNMLDLLNHKTIKQSGVLLFENVHDNRIIKSIFINTSYSIPHINVSTKSINLGKVGVSNAWKDVSFNFTIFNLSESSLRYKLIMPPKLHLESVLGTEHSSDESSVEKTPLLVDTSQNLYIFELEGLSESIVFCSLKLKQEDCIESKDVYADLVVSNIDNASNIEKINVNYSITTPGIEFDRLSSNELILTPLRHPYIFEAPQSDNWFAITNVSDVEPTLELLFDLNPLLNNLVKLSLRFRKSGTLLAGILKLAPKERIELRIVAQAIDGTRIPIGDSFKELLDTNGMMYGTLSVFLRLNLPQQNAQSPSTTDTNTPICIKKIAISGTIIEENTFRFSTDHVHLFNDASSGESDSENSPEYSIPDKLCSENDSINNVTNYKRNQFVITNLLTKIPLELCCSVEYPVEVSNTKGIISISPSVNGNITKINPGESLHLNIFLLNPYIFGLYEDIKVHFADCASINKNPKTLYISIGKKSTLKASFL